MPRWLLAEIEDRDTGLDNVNIKEILSRRMQRLLCQSMTATVRSATDNQGTTTPTKGEVSHMGVLSSKSIHLEPLQIFLQVHRLQDTAQINIQRGRIWSKCGSSNKQQHYEQVEIRHGQPCICSSYK
eukprot:4747467-Ditylum_brightwellii.AAC.1